MHAEAMTATDEADWGVLSQLPGNPMMWILIFSEMLAFGAIFLAFAGARAVDPATFAAGQQQLDPLLGGLNTLVLVSSGYIVALGVRARSDGHIARSRWLTVAAAAVGSIFVVLKLVEYGAKFDAGIGIDTDTFFMLYFLMTGFHFLHVILGIVVLLIVAWRNSLENLETGGSFWHMVDLIWVVMFPLVYLMP